MSKRATLPRFAFEIADGLPDFRDDRAIRSSVKAYRLDVRTPARLRRLAPALQPRAAA